MGKFFWCQKFNISVNKRQFFRASQTYPRKLLNKGETTRNPQKPCLNSWQGSAQLSPHATAFRVLYWWRRPCKQISHGCLEIFKKIITLLTVTVLFLFTFFNLILDAPRIQQKLSRKKILNTVPCSLEYRQEMTNHYRNCTSLRSLVPPAFLATDIILLNQQVINGYQYRCKLK